MTFNQFKYLSEDDQEFLLWSKGVEIDRREDGNFNFILYQVDGFYMEVKFILSERTIIEIVCFEEVDQIEIYLQKIKIDPLFEAW